MNNLHVTRWAQEEVGVPLGVLTEGSIEVCNKDVKLANQSFVTRVSSERIQKDIVTRRNWEQDPILHYEMTVRQVIRRGNIHPRKKKRDEDEELNGNNELEVDMVFGNEQERMAMMAEIEEDWEGEDEMFLVE